MIVEELAAALSVEWAWEHASQSPHEDGAGRPGGGGEKQLEVGECVPRVPEAKEKVGVWGKGAPCKRDSSGYKSSEN